jgi:hypothetical protein
MGDVFQAKGTLNSLIDNFPQENVKVIARDKLKRISDEEMKKQKQLQADSVDN